VSDWQFLLWNFNSDSVTVGFQVFGGESVTIQTAPECILVLR
jgi:hypothetical protein